MFSGQAVFYAVRERRRVWSSWPSRWLFLSSAVDVVIISVLAAGGVLMTPLPVPIIADLGIAALALTFLLDAVKAAAFRWLNLSH